MRLLPWGLLAPVVTAALTASRLLLPSLLGIVAADPTWPSPTDELEEIMYQLKAFRGRRFADTVDPCSNEASGPGRQNAAEWLRLGFHDMSTADVAEGRGGLDGSIQYMLDNGENLGPGFNTTLAFLSSYLSPRTSLSDLIALGVYTSVRACGGPAIPVRGGRVDAPGPGSTGVPQPEHSIDQFRRQFARMGFTPEEMIQVTACGHTLGGVHRNEFPELISEDEVGTDSTVAAFDPRVVTEYLDGNTTNPLVVGPAVSLGKDSDRRIFNSDGNATVKAMADPARFRAVCQKVLQKMIDVVPKGVVLSDPVRPYMLKPVGLQMTLEPGGKSLRLAGYIRVRTTHLPATEIRDITIAYRDRLGGSECDGRPCAIRATLQGRSRGFDDSFAFFPIEATFPAERGISSFNVTLNLKNGTSHFYDNNGQGYPLQDAVMLQRPQSCLMQHTGALRATAAVRNDRLHLPVTLVVSYKQPRPGLPVPGLHRMTMTMRRGACVGLYTLYTAEWTIPGGISFASKIDIVSGEVGRRGTAVADEFIDAVDLSGKCSPFRGPPAHLCSSLGVGSSTAAAGGVAEQTRTQTTTGLVAAVPTTMFTTTTTATTPATAAGGMYLSSSSPTAVPPQGEPDASLQSPDATTNGHALHLGETFISFFQYLTNYVVNYFFSYDRWQLVNNQLDRVT